MAGVWPHDPNDVESLRPKELVPKSSLPHSTRSNPVVPRSRPRRAICLRSNLPLGLGTKAQQKQKYESLGYETQQRPGSTGYENDFYEFPAPTSVHTHGSFFSLR